MKSLQPSCGAGLRFVLALLWVLVPWIGSSIPAAAHQHECMLRRQPEAHPSAGHHGAHLVPTGAVPSHSSVPTVATGDSCSHCASPECATRMHCEAGTTVALLPASHLAAVASSERMAEGWLADRPLSANPTPPTPPPLPAS